MPELYGVEELVRGGGGGSRSGRRPPGGPQEVVDLLGGVGGGQLDAEAGLLAGDHRVGGEGHVDAAVEQLAADRVQVGRVGHGQLDQGEAGGVGGGDAELVQVLEHGPGPLPQAGPELVAPALVDLEAGQGGGQRGHRDRAGVHIGRHRRLEVPLELGRAGHEGQQRRVGLGEAGREHDVVVLLAGPAHDRVAAAPVGGRVVAVALAGDPEAVGVVHVQQGVVLAGQGGEGRQVGRVAGHRVDPVHAHQARAVARGPGAAAGRARRRRRGTAERSPPGRRRSRRRRGWSGGRACRPGPSPRRRGPGARRCGCGSGWGRRGCPRPRAARSRPSRPAGRARGWRSPWPSWDGSPSGPGRPAPGRSPRGRGRARGSCRRRSRPASGRRPGSAGRRPPRRRRRPWGARP